MWSALQSIDTGLASFSQSAAIASNGDGYAVAWVQDTEFGSSDQRVWGSVYAAGAWSAPQLLSGVDAVGNQSVSIASNGTGYAVTWDDFDDRLVQTTIYDGSSWVGPTVAATSRDQAFPEVVSDGTGYLLYWASRGLTDSTTNVYGVLTPTGDPADFGMPTRLTDDLENIRNRYAAGGPAGYVLAWSIEGGDDLLDIFASTWDGTQWSDTASLEAAEGNANILDLAASDSGFAVLFDQGDTTDIGGLRSLFANRFDGTSWSGAEALESSDEELGDDGESGGEIVATGDTFGVAWSQAGDDDDTVHVWFASNDGSGWVARQLEDQGTDADNTRIGAEAGGAFSVLWRQEEPGGTPFVRLPWVYPGVE